MEEKNNLERKESNSRVENNSVFDRPKDSYNGSSGNLLRKAPIKIKVPGFKSKLLMGNSKSPCDGSDPMKRRLPGLGTSGNGNPSGLRTTSRSGALGSGVF